MSVVLDANALVVLALDKERAAIVEPWLREWEEQGESLHAPALLPFEIVSALAQAVSAGQLPAGEVAGAWRRISAVPIALHELDDAPGVVSITQQLQRKSAYDAAYVALARQLDTELWTLDGRLARNAETQGLPVKLIEPREDTPEATENEPAKD